MAIVVYWVIAVFVVSRDHEFLSNPLLFSIIAILTCSFTVHQLVKIWRIGRR
ncbi:hypothetical protein LCD52_13675 [Rossellomorea vietnamensis]|uniref:hypothetical protein n=1 Tax=Rossellomorea vietnamensis TaxID=218284 RepID=UPI001CCDB950|nr:hypothetical protein [Rossellomorea vietnamensis]MCA0149844.1 hypothetical protein [Rossellomorea vietnamensis]